MVIDKEELKPLHKLTRKGEEEYKMMLEKKADEILFKHAHPFKWAMQKVKEMFNEE